MLEKIREGSQGVIAKTILVLVILSFAFAGVSSYLGKTTEVPAATVNGQDITKTQFEQAYQNERARMQQQLGDMFETLAANDAYIAGLKKSVLDRLVAETLLEQAAYNLGLRVSDEQIKQAIFNEPAFQTDGKFDNARFQSIMRQLNYQPASFSEMMRKDMTRQQLVNALVGTEFVLSDEVDSLAKLQAQTRDIQYKIVDSAPFLKDVKISDADAKAFYDKNPQQFLSPEKVSLNYIELNVADLAKNESVTEQEAKTYYDEHKSQYQTQEKRLAAHILINNGDDPVAAKAKADKLYKELEQGADFATLAKANSNDQFSAQNGGQLDWFEKGVMDPAFDNALFAIPAKGDISDVVKTDFGYHIIKLLDIQPVVTSPFSKVKENIVKQLQEKKALDVFYQLQQKLADVSYEVPDTLDETAKAVNLKIQSTPLFSRNDAPAKLNVPELVKAAFSDQVMQSGMNSDVIELSPNHVVVIRVNKHQNAGTLPFDDVKADIVTQLQNEKASELALAKAQSMVKELKEHNNSKNIELTSQTQLARNTQAVDSAIVAKAFEMPKPLKNPVIETVRVAKGYAIVKLDKVNNAEKVEDSALSNIKQVLISQLAQSDYMSVIENLKAKAEITYPEA